MLELKIYTNCCNFKLISKIVHVSMTKSLHKIYLISLIAIVLFVFISLIVYGGSYYATNLQNRFFLEQNELLKPSGLYGHGMGILGSIVIIIGVFGYMARKRIRIFMRVGVLKYWLEFHIFLCSLGPVLILFHTTFKFGGIVAISFWSMVAVVMSGIIGRFIYVQIPRTLEGRELSLNEINNLKDNVEFDLQKRFKIDQEIINRIEERLKLRVDVSKMSFISGIFSRLSFEKNILNEINVLLKSQDLSKKSRRKVLKLFNSEIVLNRRIEWLSTMQNLLRYWHVLHLPFALIMLIIMIIHVGIAVTFGYTWIY